MQSRRVTIIWLACLCGLIGAQPDKAGVLPSKNGEYSVNIRLKDNNRREERVTSSAEGVPHVKGILEHVYPGQNTVYIVEYEAGARGYKASYRYSDYESTTTPRTRLSNGALKAATG
ncbi:uncharacterized protein LOC115633230 [Scaptodrosophila lebanonensis]|uniref:Uncharacterized protein LOC115633230 n=1 Tax=Drosophila lebanonensis TaxID=7225 RepID=A0A6J2UDN9_DROLE|nr:uncharacterized protein LOC115633230 [Scaptodrosophila lebanonensis]